MEALGKQPGREHTWQTAVYCTCTTDPYNCPEGQHLVQAIHDRKMGS